MSRQTPRFLYSNPANTKIPGPFISHALDPAFTVRVARCPNYEKGFSTHNGKYILFFNEQPVVTKKLIEATDAMYRWIEAQEKAGIFKIEKSNLSILSEQLKKADYNDKGFFYVKK